MIKVPSTYRYADLFKRIVANIIDLFIIGLFSSFLDMFIILPLYFIDADLFSIKELVVSMNLFVFILYFPFFESSSIMATPGKHIMGLVVTSQNRSQLSLRDALLRSFLKVFSFLSIFGFLSASRSPKKQAMHDRIGKTLVLSKKYD